MADYTPVAPRRTADQRLESLRLANEVRSLRAQLKRDLAAGNVLIADVLAQPPDYARSIPVSVLLLAVPQYGPARVTRLLANSSISASKRLAALTERQRGVLIDRFRQARTSRSVTLYRWVGDDVWYWCERITV